MKADAGGERESTLAHVTSGPKKVKSDAFVLPSPLMRSVKTPAWIWENICDEGALTPITVNAFRPPLHPLPHSSSVTHHPARP